MLFARQLSPLGTLLDIKYCMESIQSAIYRVNGALHRLMPLLSQHKTQLSVTLEENLEYRSGRGGGWFVIGECDDDPDLQLREAFSLEIACELIGETEQEDGIQVLT